MAGNHFVRFHTLRPPAREDSMRALFPAPIIAVCLCLILAVSASAAERPLIYAFEAGGGAFVPLDSEHRSAYGTGTEFSFGFSPMLSEVGTWLIFEVGLVKSAGHEYNTDPTFEMDEDKYWLVPIRLGVRRDVLGDSKEVPMKFCLGAGFQTTLTGWEDGNGTSYKSPTFGFFMEIRPEFSFSDTWGIWLCNRMTFLGNVEYEDSGIPNLNYSSNSLQLGLSYAVNR